MYSKFFFEETKILGARVSAEECGCETISFVRAARSYNQPLFKQFLLSDVISTCVVKGLHAIRLKGDGLPDGMEKDLSEMGFRKAGTDFLRLCLTGSWTREEIIEEASQQFPVFSGTWACLSNRQILAWCSPVVLKEIEEPCFIVPIKPAYAMSLFDKQSAGEDLFGGRTQVLMRWANAYYRRKTHHRVLRAPARVLWYESGRVGAITATSHLQSVEIGSPKDLFRKFREFGTLDWADIYSMCDGDISRQIMALEFSHTFPLRSPVTLDVLRSIEGRHAVPLQSPRSIGNTQLLQIMEMGFEGASV